ncbi:MAG: hypothetical protein JXR86_10975 [Spirochaetales bacterium]|nr:hypothetical protein [Spirochaetales bacterium]
MIILLFLFSLSVTLPANSDRQLIEDIERIVDESLNLFKRLGKTGTEIVRGEEGGAIIYKTELTGFNSVLNTVEYDAYRKNGFVITGSIRNSTDWAGSGTSTSSFRISGNESFALDIEMTLHKKRREKGYYCLNRENCEKIIIPYSSPE